MLLKCIFCGIIYYTELVQFILIGRERYRWHYIAELNLKI